MSTSEIDELLQRAVADRVLPGVVAMVGDRDGVTYEGAFGLLNIDGDARVRPDTLFALMSMTKAFTSVAALQLIEQGALELQQPVAEIVPAFAEPEMRRSGSGDWAGLFNCNYWIDRTAGVAGVLLTQVLPFCDAQIVETAAGFEMGVYAEVGAPQEA